MRWWVVIAARCALSMASAAAIVHGEARGQEVPEPARIDPAALIPSVDTFAVVMAGDTVATQIVRLDRTTDGFLFEEETRGTSGMQNTTVRISPEGTVRSVAQRGEAAGRQTRIDVIYEGGRAHGDAVVPGRAGIRRVVVDAEVPRTVIDDNTLVALLPALRLEPGRELALPVFASGTNTLAEYTLTVSETEPLRVAGVSYPAVAVHATAGERTIRFVITRDAPHEVLRIDPGGPVRVVRISAVR